MVTTGAWYTDPDLWKAAAGVAGAYLSSNAQKKGTLEFKQQPETPEEKAYRLYAENLAGMHGTPGPTYAYLAPQIHNMLSNLSAQSDAYQGLERLDPATGKPVARAPVATTPFDYSTLPQNWQPGVALNVGGPSATGAPSIPPPPPEVKTLSSKERTNKRAKGILKGLIGGAVTGGGYGGVVGAVTGALGAKKSNEQAWKDAWAPYNEWKALYGNSFTDAAGRPIPPPKNLAEYNAWYVSKYGTAPPKAA